MTLLTPVIFTCEAELPLAPTEIAAQVLDVARWTEFRGRWPIPGIAVAEFEVRTSAVVGSRIRVTNRDGSRHIEEITNWNPEHCIQLRMAEFSPPLSQLATHFIETWEFERRPTTTRAVRRFELHARSRAAKAALWVIARFLQRAVTRHLGDLQRR